MLYPEVKVVGAHFRGGDAVEASKALTPDTVLRLEREPDNPYDSYAIKVFYESLWIGYIERGQASWIAAAMDEGAPASAVVTGHLDVPNSRGKVVTYPVVTVTVE